MRLRRVGGLLFWRLLGTGRGDITGPSADLRRSALFAVWDDESALDHFLTSGPIARRHCDAEEAWHVRLRAVGGHGSWRGFDVLGGLERGSSAGPIAVLTRADVRARSWRRFALAGAPVDATAATTPGLRALVGIGEAPVARLGTFSLWDSMDAVRSFASSPVHAEVVARTRTEGWYGEELFARFEPFGSSGTWDGVDPAAPRP